MDDDLDVEAQAQPGPIYDREVRRERAPLTWVDVALFGGFVAFSLGMVAGGAVILAMPKSMAAGVYVGNVVCGAVMIIFGTLLTATFVIALVLEWRRGRKIRALSRLHIAPVALPRPAVKTVALAQLPDSAAR